MALTGHPTHEEQYKMLMDKRVGRQRAARKAWERSPPSHVTTDRTSRAWDRTTTTYPSYCVSLIPPPDTSLMHCLLHFFVMLKLLCLADSFIFSYMYIPPPSLLYFLFTSHTFPVLTQHLNSQPRVPLLSPKVGNIMAQPAFITICPRSKLMEMRRCVDKSTAAFIKEYIEYFNKSHSMNCNS